MRLYRYLVVTIFLFFSVFMYATDEKDIAEGSEGRGNRSGGYPFGIEMIDHVMYITFYQTMEYVEISVLSESSECIYRDAFSPCKGESCAFDLSDLTTGVLLQVRLPDGSLVSVYPLYGDGTE